MKTSVHKNWPENIDTALIVDARDFERSLQERKRNQLCIDFFIKGLQPLSLKQKAHDNMTEQPNSIWDELKIMQLLMI